MGEEFSNYAECCKSSAKQNNPVDKERMSLPELSIKALKLLEKTLAIQTDTAAALNHHLEAVPTPSDMNNLYSLLDYIWTLAEANFDAASIIHNTIG